MPSAAPARATRAWAVRALTLSFAAVSVATLPKLVPNRFWLSISITILFKTLLASSVRLNHLMGFISLGQVGFMLTGAYTSALLASKCSVPVLLAIPCGAALAGLLALVVGFPFLRVKGVYFVVLTFLMAEALRLTALYSDKLTGGETGLANIPGLPDVRVGDWSWSLSETDHYYYVLVIVTGAVLGGLYVLERSRFGFYCKTIAESEAVCRAAGLNTMAIKLCNFTLAATVAGLAGSLWAHFETVLTPTFSSVFGLLSSIFLLVYLHVGGADHFLGPLVGVSCLVLLEQVSGVDERHVPLLLGVSLMLAVFLLPRGVTGALRRSRLLLRLGAP